MKSKLQIHIIYCGGWGYSSRFKNLRKKLERTFPDQLEITGESTPGISGKFEVRISNGPFLHSKKRGMGFIDTEEKFASLSAGICQAMEKVEVKVQEKVEEKVWQWSKSYDLTHLVINEAKNWNQLEVYAD